MKSMDFDEAVASGKVKWIEDAVLERYYDAVLAQSREQACPTSRSPPPR